MALVAVKHNKLSSSPLYVSRARLLFLLLRIIMKMLKYISCFSSGRESGYSKQGKCNVKVLMYYASLCVIISFALSRNS